MLSMWSDTAVLPEYGRLEGNVRTDVLVIGGGMAGILCAYFLRQAGVRCVLAEADRLYGGVTKNTTAKLTSQHGLVYDGLLRRFGAEKAGMYLHANEAALARYRAMCRKIDCGFEEKDAFVYSLDDREKIEKELVALEKLGFHADFTDKLPLPFAVAGAVRFERQAQFDPLRFAAAVAKGLEAYEHTPVRRLDGTSAVTDHGTIRAQKIIVATHFPFLNRHGSYFLKLYQHRSYVLALESAASLGGMYVDEAEDGLSFRNARGLLLLVGGGHRTGKQGGAWRELEAFAGRHYPRAHVRYRWAAQDCMTLDGAPYIGPYSARTENLYVATGFNKWGMTSAMAAAMLLTEMVQGKKPDDAAVFSPSRSILRPQLALNALEAAASLLTPSAKRCPHMGCALKWNPQEHSWDCPCHGSRFTQEGRLIENPAMRDLKQ